MHPILFNFFGIPIYSYGVLVATGVLISLWYGRLQAPRAGIDPDKLWNMGIYFVLVALLVAKIWLILSAWDFYMANPRYIFSVATFQSGGTFFRGDPGRTMMFHDSVSLMQITSLVLILTGAFLWWRGLQGKAPIQPVTPM